MSIALQGMPPPNLVAHADEAAMAISSSGSLPFHSRLDPQLSPRRLRLAWSQVSGAVANAIDQHYTRHRHAVWSLRIPDTAETVRVQWAAPPTIQWASEAFASSVSGEVEEVLAYE